jgi:hypothetical protein
VRFLSIGNPFAIGEGCYISTPHGEALLGSGILIVHSEDGHLSGEALRFFCFFDTTILNILYLTQ